VIYGLCREEVLITARCLNSEAVTHSYFISIHMETLFLVHLMILSQLLSPRIYTTEQFSKSTFCTFMEGTSQSRAFRKLNVFLSSDVAARKQIHWTQWLWLGIAERPNLFVFPYVFARWRREIQLPKLYVLFGILEDGHGPETQNMFLRHVQSWPFGWFAWRRTFPMWLPCCVYIRQLIMDSWNMQLNQFEREPLLLSC
jgi:hypothetical protein